MRTNSSFHGIMLILLYSLNSIRLDMKISLVQKDWFVKMWLISAEYILCVYNNFRPNMQEMKSVMVVSFGFIATIVNTLVVCCCLLLFVVVCWLFFVCFNVIWWCGVHSILAQTFLASIFCLPNVNFDTCCVVAWC